MAKNSATEALGRPEAMASDTKQVPRSGEFAIASVAKGVAYGETSGTNDYVELIARKIGGVLRVAEEDLQDNATGEDLLAIKRVDAARNMAKFYDNATLGTSGTANGTTILYTSVYKAIRTTDSDVSYTADDHYVSGSMSGSAGYDNLSTAFGHYEDSDWFDSAETFVIASPAYKQSLRGVKDNNGTPIFQEGVGPSPDQVFGVPITWSQACRVSGTNTTSPTGNPLLIVGNRRLLINGMAKLSPEIAAGNPGFALQRAREGTGFLTDEALLKVAARRAFAIGNPHGFAVMERTS